MRVCSGTHTVSSVSSWLVVPRTPTQKKWMRGFAVDCIHVGAVTGHATLIPLDTMEVKLPFHYNCYFKLVTTVNVSLNQSLPEHSLACLALHAINYDP
jgi:hypothetical protein